MFIAMLTERGEGRCGRDDRERELHARGDEHDAPSAWVIGHAPALRFPSTLVAHVEY